MTSLIDVIFLLLLFFMLTSTFSKFAEIELAAATSGAGAETGAKPFFLQLTTEGLRLNGDALALDALAGVTSRSAATALCNLGAVPGERDCDTGAFEAAAADGCSHELPLP